MSLIVLTALSTVLLAASPAVAPAPVPAPAGKYGVIDLIPQQMPPTRTTCEVRTENLTIRVEWSPQDFSHLRQRVTLPNNRAEVKVQCWSALEGKDATAKAWSFGEEQSITKDEEWIGDQVALKAIKVVKGKLPEIKDRLDVLDTQLAGDASARSLASPVPDAVAQTVKVLGDIALKRAKAHAREMLMDRMTGAICGNENGDGNLPKYWLYLPDDIVVMSSKTYLMPSRTYHYKLVSSEGGTKWSLPKTADAPYCVDNRPYDDGKVDAKTCAGWPRFVPPTVSPTQESATITITGDKKRTATLKRGEVSRFKVQLVHTCQLVRGRSLADLSRSGPELARALEADALTMLVDNLTSFARAYSEVPPEVVSMLQLVLPVLVDAAKESRAPSTREALTIVSSVRQALTSDSFKESRAKPHLDLALAIVADCVEAGVCDLRLVSAKVANPEQYYQLAVPPPIPIVPMNPQQRQQLVRIVDGIYGLFAPNPELKDRDRTVAAIGAVSQAISFVVAIKATNSTGNDTSKIQALRDTLDALNRVVVASIREDYGTMTAEAAAMLSGLIRLYANDLDCVGPETQTGSDARGRCSETLLRFARRLERALPWITTLAAHAVQIRDERSNSLTAAELEQNAEARKKALEELIDRSTDRKGRDGDWVWSFGAGVGARAAGTVGGKLFTRFVETPLTLPIGVAVQWLPGPKKGRSILSRNRAARAEALKQGGSLASNKTGVGLHFQASPVDVGQYVFLSEDIENVSWNQFLSANAQAGLLVGTAKTNVVIALDYRYVPARGLGLRHELGLALTYYIPFFDFN